MKFLLLIFFLCIATQSLFGSPCSGDDDEVVECGDNICDYFDNPQIATFVFLGIHGENMHPYYDLKVTDKRDIDDSSAKIYFENSVYINDHIIVDSETENQNELPKYIHFHFIDPITSENIFSLKIRIKCKSELYIGDTFSDVLQLYDYVDKNGCSFPSQCNTSPSNTPTLSITPSRTPTPSISDLCPGDPYKTEPGICGCGISDLDSDADGTPDCNDLCPNDPFKIEPSICGCGMRDTDTDIDGTPDCIDECPLNPLKIEQGICGCELTDIDSDNDGTLDCNDECPLDPAKTNPGECGCGISDMDSDNDGYKDCIDLCPIDPLKSHPELCGCGVFDNDSDNDGTPDCNDLCPDDPNKIYPGECGCNNEEIPSCFDECPNDPDKITPGICGCGTPDTDLDYDSTPDCVDVCPLDPFKNTTMGLCGCGAPETDSDSDGVPDCLDLCPNDPNKSLPGLCGCGYSDQDSDQDGTVDCLDMCPNDPYKIQSPGLCGCGVVDTDSDNDGIPDCLDGCPFDSNKINAGICGCGTHDIDSDVDGTYDCNDGCPFDFNKVSPGMCGCNITDLDSDFDGIYDCNDGCPFDFNKIDPGMCGCGELETDSDLDNVPDCIDLCPLDILKVSPGICGCGIPDLLDTDLDGVLDCIDICPLDPLKTEENICGCSILDTDSDNDYTPDCVDGCPLDLNKIDPGGCGCGILDLDTDLDHIYDCLDECPLNEFKYHFDECGCDIDYEEGYNVTRAIRDFCSLSLDSYTISMLRIDLDMRWNNIDYEPPLFLFWQHNNSATLKGTVQSSTDPDTLFYVDFIFHNVTSVSLDLGILSNLNLGLLPTCYDTLFGDISPSGWRVFNHISGTLIALANSTYEGAELEISSEGYIPQLGLGANNRNTNLGLISFFNWNIINQPNNLLYTLIDLIDLNVVNLELSSICSDSCPNDPLKDKPGICGCGVLDIDLDLDGTPDCIDGCPLDILKTIPGQCGCGIPDIDLDNDGVADCIDNCPLDPLKIEPEQCGCGISDLDTDYDGIADCFDGCPFDYFKIEPGLCGCGISDLLDADLDGTPDCIDMCPLDPLKINYGICGCGIGDIDTDLDGILDCMDDCPLDILKINPGICGCGIEDIDTDLDGVSDCIDECPLDPLKISYGYCGCGIEDIDSDLDSVPDCLDLCPYDPLKISPEYCGCGEFDISRCCSCENITSISFLYEDNFQLSPNVTIRVSLGNLLPLEYSNITHGDYLTFFTWGDIQDGHVFELEILDGTHNTLIESDDFELTCNYHPHKGHELLSGLFVHEISSNYIGHGCQDYCKFSLGIVIDLTSEHLYSILSQIKHKLINKLAGEYTSIALYTLDYDGSSFVYYTENLNNYDDYVHLIDYIDALIYSPNEYTDWISLFETLYNHMHYNHETILFFIEHGPVYHNNTINPIQESLQWIDLIRNDNSTNINHYNIISISLADILHINSTLDVSYLQLISGYYVQHNYFLNPYYEYLSISLDLISSYLCCDTLKDICGVCYGNSLSCLDCSGNANGMKEYDYCGVCDGNGDTCPPPECDEHTSINIEEWTGLNITAYEHTKKFKFEYTTNLPEDTILILSFSELNLYDDSGDQYIELPVYNRGSCDNLYIMNDDNYNNMDLLTNYDYCNMFNYEFWDTHANIWDVQYNNFTHHLHLSSEFSIYDLLTCQTYEGVHRLIDTIQPNRHYSGTLYGYIIKKPTLCDYNLFDSEVAHTQVLFGTHYNFDLWFYGSGEIGTEVTSSSSTVNAEWKGNKWLASGDVIIEFTTEVITNDDTDHHFYLDNPIVLVQNQTGIPFQFLSGTDCDNTTTDGCKQTWEIRTYGASGVMDFSGMKAIQFDLFAHGISKSNHIVWLNVTIIRGIDPIDSSLSINAWVDLYKDEYFINPLNDTNNSIVNCHHVFGKVFIHDIHADDTDISVECPIQINKVELCISAQADYGYDLIPFDPDNPSTTGCNTPGIEVISYILYSRYTDYVNDFFDFQFIDHNSSDISSSYFKFKVRAITSGIQQLQILWSTDYHSHTDLHHLSSSIIDPVKSHRLSSHSSHIKKLNFTQYNTKYYNDLLVSRLADINSLSLLRENINDDDNIDDTNHSYHFSRGKINVVCEDDEYYNDGECHSYSYSNFTFLNFLLAFLFLLFCFAICILLCWCYNKIDLAHYTNNSHNATSSFNNRNISNRRNNIPMVRLSNVEQNYNNIVHHHHHHKNHNNYYQR